MIHVVPAAALAAFALCAAPLTDRGTPSPASTLAGTWSLVAVDNIMPDGSRVALYGDHPAGMLTFDPQGRYSLLIFRGEQQPFASGDKSRGTADEYRAASLGVNAHFGSYDVDDARATITFHIEHASFPNWSGTTQVRAFSIVGDTLSYRVPVPTSGDGAVGEVRWVRRR